jgi:hypothetical protein
VSSNLGRCLSSVFTAYFDLSSYVRQPRFGPSRITSAASDVLANFSRLSTSISSVNLFFLLFVVFSSQQEAQTDILRTAQNYQNIETLKRARSTQLLVIQINCSGLGLDCRPAIRLSTAHQTLGLRSVIPLLAGPYFQGQGEKQYFFATHLEYRAFHFRASRTHFCDFLRVSVSPRRRNPWPVDN